LDSLISWEYVLFWQNFNTYPKQRFAKVEPRKKDSREIPRIERVSWGRGKESQVGKGCCGCSHLGQRSASTRSSPGLCQSGRSIPFLTPIPFYSSSPNINTDDKAPYSLSLFSTNTEMCVLSLVLKPML
jgi:hypothetical protein